MAWGAHRYLLKPVAPKELIEAVTRAVLLSDLARLKREAFALRGAHGLPVDDEKALDASFTRALDRLAIVFHPIVSMRERRALGFEALVRSTEPTLQHPEALLGTASLLGRSDELTRAIYTKIAEQAQRIPEDRLLFVNVHPPDLLDHSLHGIGSPLAPFADRIVLEITERASIERMGDITSIVKNLRLLGYRLAVDDLGTGYAGLSSFTQLSPEIVKLDRSLVEGIDENPTKQRVVRAMLQLCEDLQMQAICEGIEKASERDALVAMGADLLQGYLFGLPAPHFDDPRSTASGRSVSPTATPECRPTSPPPAPPSPCSPTTSRPSSPPSPSSWTARFVLASRRWSVRPSSIRRRSRPTSRWA